ncbi:MAG TPA: hypothetical protein VNW97_13525 [Candidatus Saccharimonadales bacterium]|nr:hypothetical protein [Candidatus Saccharimonadales bacterium]
MTTTEKIQKLSVVDWSVRNLGIGMPLRQFFFDEHEFLLVQRSLQSRHYVYDFKKRSARVPKIPVP